MEQFADIEGPVRLGLLITILLIAGGVLLLALLVWLAYRLSHRRQAAAQQSSVPMRSPLEIAMERLRQLRTGKDELEAEPFTIEVSDVVRDYLESTLEIPAREQTSEEFLQALQFRKDLPGVLDSRMPAFLEQCDRVKFARQSLGDEARNSLLETAEEVVDSTARHTQPQSTEENPAPV